MAASISTHTANNAEYERKKSPSMLIESITKQAEKARKYERILECGLRCWKGYTNGNNEAQTVIGVRMTGGFVEVWEISHLENPNRGSGS